MRRILVSAPYILPVIERFRPIFDDHGLELVLPVVHERLSEAELFPYVRDIDAAICGDDCYTERVLAAAPRLRVISKWGTGIDSIDQAACRRFGITVCNTPDAFTLPVADTTLGYLLSFVRDLHTQSAAILAGRWQKVPLRSVAECTIGIIGVGHIGQEVARRLTTFGARLLGVDPIRPPVEFLRATDMELVELPQLLAESDVVTLHCDLNPTSYRVLNGAAFAAMRPGAFIINTARGHLIDEPLLVAALERGTVVGAALDVYEAEPLPDNSPLRRLPNVLLAAHNANSSPRAWERVHRNTIDNVLKHLPSESA